MIRYHFRRLGKNERGANMIEFALVMPVLLAFLFGIIEFGWILNGYVTLTGAAKEGVRLAVIGEDDETVIDVVERHAFTFQFDDTTGGQTVKHITVDRYDTGIDRKSRVNARGKLPLLIGFFPFIENPFPLETEAVMRWESSIDPN